VIRIFAVVILCGLFIANLLLANFICDLADDELTHADILGYVIAVIDSLSIVRIEFSDHVHTYIHTYID
jgi:1,4-dihydroxy-2-naphthoate octaprenyltransferase